MNCPSCNRNLSTTLSVCPSCGTMVFDSVREELAMKITSRRLDSSGELTNSGQLMMNQESSKPFESEVKTNASAEISVEKKETKPPTSELNPKHTSPTLVEFHNRNATLPEWRLQLQNSVRRRNDRDTPEKPQKPKAATIAARATQTETSGATALKPRLDFEELPAASLNPALERAMKRIEESRKKFHSENTPNETTHINGTVKTFPVQPAGGQRDIQPKPGHKPAVITKFVPKKPAISDDKTADKKFDTNKLPPLSIEIRESFEGKTSFADADSQAAKSNLAESKTASAQKLSAITDDEINGILNNIMPDVVEEEGFYDDCAPLSLRFTAGFFDLLIGSFVSFILISPFIFTSESVFSMQSLLTFLVVCAIVMFIYMTGSIALIGRTLGMRLFSLEIIDAAENSYPSIHQAAVSSSVYLLSLAFGGLGFLTLLTNKEKRAAHDLISGTIIVKEYE